MCRQAPAPVIADIPSYQATMNHPIGKQKGVRRSGALRQVFPVKSRHLPRDLCLLFFVRYVFREPRIVGLLSPVNASATYNNYLNYLPRTSWTTSSISLKSVYKAKDIWACL